MKNLVSLLSFMLIGCLSAFGQEFILKALPSDTVPAIINFKEENGAFKFSSLLRPLRQIAGAPEPFYTYFWEFGDGKFSFDKEPLHQYADTVLRNVRLFAINSYDDGKRPPTRPKPIKPGSSKPVLASTVNGQNFFKSGGSLEMKTNSMPKPGDDMMLIFGYRNKSEHGIANLNGTLTILYNDKEFDKDNFELVTTRNYNGEKNLNYNANSSLAILKPNHVFESYLTSLSGPNILETNGMMLDADETALVKQTADGFRTGQSWKFENLKSGEEKFLFFEFKTTPEMIKDTNAVVKLTGIFVPENPLITTELFTMELQIVASHDPNKMMLKNSRMNFRFTGKNKQLTYKVRFQNTGKGPAKKVDVGVAISAVLDKSSVKIIDSKPKLLSCDSAYANQSCLDTVSSADSLHFVFRNIYLPGLQQEGVEDADSTMGFIQYQIGFKDKPKKLPFNSGAAIVFDKNEPIYTNRSVGKYKTGFSPGVIAGYGFPLERGNTPAAGQKSLSLGASIAPYAPHRYFLQAELYASYYSEKEYLINRTDGGGRVVVLDGANGRKEEFRINYIDSTAKIKALTINIVPIQLRRNFNKYFGAGIGSLISFNLKKESLPSRSGVLESLVTPGTTTTIKENYAKLKNGISDFQNTIFADIQVGKVHVGPAIGFRYLYTIQNTSNRLITYLTWKF
ncbi:MAG: hypothetical protein V4687_06470 [Bacteroidota bacterium]